LIRPSALRRRYRRAQGAAGLRPLRFHDLRHSFGSLVIREFDPVAVKDFMGHSKITTTERYLHARSRRTDAARMASELIAGAETVLRSLAGRELVTGALGVADGVDAVLRAAAAERRVRPLARDARTGQHERPVHGHALGDVARDGVAVGDRRIAALGAAQQEARVELDRITASVSRDNHPHASCVHADHPAAVTAVKTRAEIVAPDHDAITGGEALAEQRHFVRAERAGSGHPPAGQAIELRDVATGCGR
jgi:hypothetical protein